MRISEEALNLLSTCLDFVKVEEREIVGQDYLTVVVRSGADLLPIVNYVESEGIWEYDEALWDWGTDGVFLYHIYFTLKVQE